MLPKANNQWSLEDAAHLMRRAGFGGSPAEIQQFHALGREDAVESLLHPQEALDAFPQPDWATPEVAIAENRKRFEEIRKLRTAGRGMSREAIEKARREAQQMRQRENRRLGVEGNHWWLKRMLQTNAPLREKMTLFWHDHFACSSQKVRQPALMMIQNDLFRQQAFGDFRTLTHKILKDPAMMLYLDTQTSKKGKPNENFAREVMELFTLGEGNYKEKDIKEAARAFTGYALNRGTGRVIHNKSQWDNRPKTVFGKTGNFDGDGLIDLLFEQSAAASYLPSKLWAYFVEDSPPQVIVDELAETFRSNDFRIEPVLREIFLSRAFYDGTVVRNQIKSPIQFLLQMSKELELEALPTGYTMVVQQQLGQVLFLPPNVAGWDWGKGWINTNTLLGRYNIAGFITKGSISAGGDNEDSDEMMMSMTNGGGKGRQGMGRMLKRAMDSWEGPDYEAIAPRPLREDPEKLTEAIIQRLFQDDVGDKSRQTFTRYAQSMKGAIFTNHEVAELFHLMMSTPQYQLA